MPDDETEEPVAELTRIRGVVATMLTMLEDQSKEIARIRCEVAVLRSTFRDLKCSKPAR